jgi:hypothetical protein
MLRRLFFLAVLCFSTTYIIRASDWVRQDVSGFCTFAFPATPTVTDINGRTDYLYVTDSSYYLVKFTTIARNNIIRDSATLFNFYVGITKGILKGETATELRKNPILINRLEAMELQYVAADQNRQPITVCSHILLVNRKLIVYTFSAPYRKYENQKSLKDRFFGSFLLKNDNGLLQYKNDADSASYSDKSSLSAPAPDASTTAEAQAGHTDFFKPNTLRFILSFAGSILALAGLLYFIVRWRKRIK